MNHDSFAKILPIPPVYANLLLHAGCKNSVQILRPYYGIGDTLQEGFPFDCTFSAVNTGYDQCC